MASPDRHFANAAIFTHSASGITPNSGDAALYIKSDNKAYIKDSTGTETEVGGGGGIAGSTGSVDNALLRADGTGGATVKSSDINVDDATTTTQNNVAITNQHAGQTNSALVLTPKGTGAFILGPKPDGTATGGNARGTKAVDLQSSRTAATQIAQGNTSFIGGGSGNTASQTGSIVVAGWSNTSSNEFSFVGSGYGNSSTGLNSVVCGGGVNNQLRGNTASGTASGILSGISCVADRYGMQAHGNGRFSANGDAQRARFVLRNATTDATPTALFLNGSSTLLTIPVNKAMGFTIQVVGSYQGMSENAYFVRKGLIVNDNLTTTIVGSVETIGTDQKSAGATGTDVTVTADDTNEALIITVTGVAAQNWRWVASVDAVEVLYA